MCTPAIRNQTKFFRKQQKRNYKEVKIEDSPISLSKSQRKERKVKNDN